MTTDHDECIEIIKKYMESRPEFFRLIDVNLGPKQGPDILAENLKLNVIEHIEVELDASATVKAIDKIILYLTFTPSI